MAEAPAFVGAFAFGLLLPLHRPLSCLILEGTKAHMYNILIVDKTISPGMKFIDAISPPDAHVRFIHQNLQAIKSVRKEAYDLILLGDRTDDGAVYDVALEVKDSRKNKHAIVICIGINKGKMARMEKLLKPYTLVADKEHFDVVVAKVKSRLEPVPEQSSTQE